MRVKSHLQPRPTRPPKDLPQEAPQGQPRCPKPPDRKDKTRFKTQVGPLGHYETKISEKQMAAKEHYVLTKPNSPTRGGIPAMYHIQ